MEFLVFIAQKTSGLYFSRYRWYILFTFKSGFRYFFIVQFVK